MTISHAAATGVTTATGARGTSSTTVAYVGVAAGRMAFIFAQCKPTSASWSAVSGWTLLADVTGGTGTDGADTGLTRLGVWYRQLDGSESGSVTVATTGGGTTTAVMHTMSKTRSTWATPVFVSGQDSGHAADFSATLGAWSQALSGGDLVLIGHSSDTDDTGAMSLPTLTQTGASFGSVTARNRLGNSDGNDGIVTSWSVSVSGGSANAPTFGFTWAASSCGPAVAIRVHEYDPISLLTDNFNDNTLTNPPWAGNYGTNSETGGRARVECGTTFAGYQTGYYYSWDGELVVEVPTMPVQGGATTECYAAGWIVDATQGSGNDIGFQLNRITGTLRFMIRTSFDEAGAPSVTIDEVAHRWWRLLNSGADLLWQTSPDGIDWTTRRTATRPSWLTNTHSSKVLLECHRNSGTNDFAEFDNVNLAPTVVSGTAASALGALTATGAGVREVPGLAAASFAVTVAGAGLREVAGAADAPLGALTATGAGVRTVDGTSSLTAASTASAVGVRTVTATAAFLTDLVAAALGSVEHLGSAAASLGGLTASAVGSSQSSIVLRPNTGTVTRPFTGIVTRP